MRESPNSVRRSLRVPLEYDISSQRDGTPLHFSNTPGHLRGMEIILPSTNLTSTQAVSILNSQEIILSMLSSQKQK